MCEHPQTHAEFRPPAEPCRSDARKSSKRASDRARTRGRRRVVSLRIRVALMICCHAHGPTAHLAAAREDGPRKRRCRWVRVPRRLGPGGSPMPMDRRQQASKRGNEQLVPVAIKLRARAMLYALSFPSSFLTGRLPCSFRDPAAPPAGCRHLWVRCGSVRFRSRRSHCLSRLHVREELGRAGHVKAAFISYCQTLIQGGYSFFLIFSSMTKLHSESRVWCCHVVRALLFV